MPETDPIWLAQFLEKGWAFVAAPSLAAQAASAADAWRRFFSSDEKFGFLHKSGLLEGYFPLGSETALGYADPDPKEFFHAYLSTPLPASLADHTCALLRTTTHIGQQICDVLRSAGTLPVDIDLRAGEEHLLRAVCYREGSKRPFAQPHADITLFSLVLFEDRPGVHILDDSGATAVSPSENEIVLLAGDMLQIASAGTVPAAQHLVLAAAGDRLSLVFFANPRSDTLLAPGVTAGQALEKRLAEMGGYA